MHPDLGDGLLWYAVFLVSASIHEASHAWSTFDLGDSTAKQAGMTSFNPWPHIRRDPIGMVAVPLASVLLGGWVFGWASTPYNRTWARKFPRKAARMSMAGPAANLVLALVAAVLLKLGFSFGLFTDPPVPNPLHLAAGAHGAVSELLARLLGAFFLLNLVLFLINLIPIPPLDGSSIPLFVLPQKAAARYFDALGKPVFQIAGLVAVVLFLLRVQHLLAPFARAAGAFIHSPH